MRLPARHVRAHRARLLVTLLLSLTALVSPLHAGIVGPRVSATKSDSILLDIDGDGNADPGETIRYTIIVANSGDLEALNVRLSDTPDVRSPLLVGSVTTTAGTIFTGNTAGDTNVLINFGDIPADGLVTATFDVVIEDPFIGADLFIANQGTVNVGIVVPGQVSIRGNAILTDDPDTPDAVDPTITPVVLDPFLTATKIDTLQIDVDDDGVFDVGDTIRYTIQVANAGPGDAIGAVFDDLPDLNTSLIHGSVVTSQGRVTIGNGVDDTVVVVALGLVAAGDEATVSFDVLIDASASPDTTTVVNQGAVVAENKAAIVTDDPDVPGADDPTVTAVAPPDPVEIPSLGVVGLTLFSLMLAMAGALVLRR